MAKWCFNQLVLSGTSLEALNDDCEQIVHTLKNMIALVRVRGPDMHYKLVEYVF